MQIRQGYINSEENNAYINLYDILNVLPNNNWYWKLFIFEGVGHAPNHMTISDFEELVDSLDEGYNMTWYELNNLANSMDDIYNCLLIATCVPSKIAYKDIEDKNITKYKECKILIEMFDSHTWELQYADDVELLHPIQCSPPRLSIIS